MKKIYKTGQVYLDILITITILLILIHAIFTLVTTSYELINFSRARTTAKHLAQEKIELIRNLSYTEIGTAGGIPPGSLPQTENIFKNGLNYVIKTSIVYIDDPFDSLAPDDLLPTDYKRTRVDVSWGGLAASSINPVTLVTDIAPRGVETTVGGGTLSILVFNANGEAVAQATVNIVADTVEPPVNLTLETADNGRVILPGSPTCSNNCYQISASKEGYSSERTYSTGEVANPNKPHQNVLEGQLTEISFAIDKTNTLIVTSTQNRENNFAPLANQSFRLKGSKTLGTDINDDPIYKFDQEFTTDESARSTINDLEWDNYDFFLPEGSSWDIAGTNPLLPLSLLPDQSLDLAFTSNPHTQNSLLIIFKNDASGPIASVSAKLSGLGFEATGSSGLNNNPDFGQLFFPGLASQNYTLEASASGFLDFNSNINVSDQTVEEVVMEGE